jgi:hypothetical protein
VNILAIAAMCEEALRDINEYNECCGEEDKEIKRILIAAFPTLAAKEPT